MRAVPIRLLTAFVLAAAASPAAALTYLVGAGAVPSQCDFNSLQAAIDAAAANPGEDFIRVASDQAYTQQALVIGQQDLTITGGYANCAAALPPDALPTGSTVLDGGGGAAAPVIRITGSGVRVLASLQIRNGDDVQANGSGCGGGVRFTGTGELQIRNTGISQNEANDGGGVCFNATAAPAFLTLGADTVINNNRAVTGSGGGVAVGGAARLFALADRTLISFNDAAGDGGGVFVRFPARSDIASPGFGSLGVLYANTAGRGAGFAGVAPEDSGDGVACMRFFSTDASRPVRLQDNRARVAGGAIYLRTDRGNAINLDDAIAVGRLYDVRIDGNTAPNGPAMFLDGDEILGTSTGSEAVLNDFTVYDPCNEPLFELGRTPCTNRAECNRIENNRAADINGVAANGNVIELRKGSRLRGGIVTMAGNVGTRLLSWSDGSGADVRLDRCALVGNVLTQELLRGFSDSFPRLSDCTIAGNQIGAAHVLRLDEAGQRLSLFNVLVDQPGKLTQEPPRTPGAGGRQQWVLASDVTTLDTDPTIQRLRGSGRFVDPGIGDYRLVVGSEAVDFAPPRTGMFPDPPLVDGPDIDLDGRARNVDLGDVSSGSRARDLGPFERAVADPYLRNGRFERQLRGWTNPAPTLATFASTINAPGSPGGSLEFNVPLGEATVNDRRTALVQCFHVPSGGTWRAEGRARVSTSMNNQDFPIFSWRLRYASDDCSGPADASGDHFFGRSGSSWQPILGEGLIPVDAAQWTWATTIEVRLDVAQDPFSASLTSLFARFDDIEIRKQSDPLFSDGFEAP